MPGQQGPLGHRRRGGGVRRAARVGDDHRAPAAEAGERAPLLLQARPRDDGVGANAHDWLEVTGLTPLELEPAELLVAPELVEPVELDRELPDPVEPVAPLVPVLTPLVVAVVADWVTALRARAGS
jgi:hypothetical protein